MKDAYPNSFIWSLAKNQFEPLTPGANLLANVRRRGRPMGDPNRHGVELPLAYRLQKKFPGKDIFFVKVAQEGTALYQEWKPGGGAMYKKLVYARGNIGMFRTDPKQDEYAAIHWFGKWRRGYDLSRLKAKEPFEVPRVTTHSHLEAYNRVLAGVGATRPKRDPVDLRLVREVETRKGRHINQAADVGGWPNLKSAPAPKDTDNDGMPDAWETKYGLNPKDASDNVGDKDKDGYTNIEECINETDPTKFVDYRKSENNVDSLRRG
jgi:hypothetical protein